MTGQPAPPLHFDYVIAGGGCAGLSLAWQMQRAGLLKSKHLLILDREAKSENDRTWCFWEKEPGPFEHLVHHAWQHAWFFGPEWSEKMNLAPYRYKMIRGDAFYGFVKKALSEEKNIRFAREEVLEISDLGEKAGIQTTENEYTADWIFNSIPPKTDKKKGHHYLLQHFTGWFIKTAGPFFNPEEPYLMDFRIEQKGECRFMYVLPTSPTEALVEFTLFSEAHLPKKEYEDALRKYLEEFLHAGSFEIEHREFGSIPMFSEPFPRGKGKRIVNIGTAGGQTKASTGYTFTRIQKHSKQLAESLLNAGHPLLKPNKAAARHQLYDRILLHVLANKKAPASEVFQNLFKKNGAAAVFRFLDEDSRFHQDLKILNSVPLPPFILAAIRELGFNP